MELANLKPWPPTSVTVTACSFPDSHLQSSSTYFFTPKMPSPTPDLPKCLKPGSKKVAIRSWFLKKRLQVSPLVLIVLKRKSSTEYWWDDTERKPKCWEKIMSQWHFVRPRLLIYWDEIESTSPPSLNGVILKYRAAGLNLMFGELILQLTSHCPASKYNQLTFLEGEKIAIYRENHNTNTKTLIRT